MTQPLLKEVTTETEVPPTAAAYVETGIGPTLRSLREARRLSPADVSMRLKFTLRQLEALETEQWDRLPSGMSLRGFVKNYARFLEADVDALLTMLEGQVESSGVRRIPVSNAAALGPADVRLQDEPTNRPWGWLVVILILLLVAGFYAVQRGWAPDSWLVFDWLKSLKK